MGKIVIYNKRENKIGLRYNKLYEQSNDKS